MRRALVIAFLFATPLAAQEFFTLKGHGGPIMDIAVAPDGQIATASFDNSVGLWAGENPTWLEGSRAAVNTVLHPAPGQIFAGGDDFTVWGRNGDADGLVEIGQHEAKITDLALSQDGGFLASASWDATIGLWHFGADGVSGPVRAEALSGHKGGVNAVAISAGGRKIYSASADGTVRVWDLDKEGDSRPLVKHGFGVNELILNEPDGWLAYGAVDGGTRVLDLETGAELADFTLGRRPILAMAHDPVQGQLAVGDGEGFIMVIDTLQMRMTGSEIVWSAETINALFDEGPDHYIPGTKMPMQRIVKQSDRDDLIEYLRVATAQGEN